MRSAIRCSRSVSCIPSRNAISSRIGRRVISEMLLPPSVTASDSGLSLAPLQERHGTSRMYCSSRSRCASESDSLYRRSTTGITPSYVVL